MAAVMFPVQNRKLLHWPIINKEHRLSDSLTKLIQAVRIQDGCTDGLYLTRPEVLPDSVGMVFQHCH
jgi:hypothetical protein